MRIVRLACGSALAGLAFGAVAQTAPPRASGVAAKTPIVIEISVPISSKTAKIGETFPLRLFSPVLDSSGDVLLPAGTVGQGEVIHAAKQGGLGRAGELILAARYLQCGDTRIPIGHLKFSQRGADTSESNAFALALGVVGAAFYRPGGEVVVPIGTRADAQINADVKLSPTITAQCLAAAPPASISSEPKGSK